MRIDLRDIMNQCSIKENASFLLAVSGGADSIYLFHQFYLSGLKFEVAHCNFQLREEESNQDELFVSQLAQEKKITCHIKRFDTQSILDSQGGSVQNTARNLRYDWFEELKTYHNIDYIVTAHHLDDRIETLFLNLFRGTGLKGLVPLPYLNGDRFRPLIDITKDSIYNYLKNNNHNFREDSSNQSLKYKRNQIRQNLIPEIEKDFPDYQSKFNQNFDRLKIASDYLKIQKESFYKSALIENSNKWSIDLKDLDTQIHSLWLLEYFGGHYNQLKQFNKFLEDPKGNQFLINSYVFTKESTTISIVSNTEKVKLVDFHVNQIPFENEIVQISSSNKVTQFIPGQLYLNLKLIEFPLRIRNWKDGDRFQPFGMQGTKLISDFLKDRKVDSSCKRDILVCTMNKEIIGILGFTCNEKFKTKDTNPWTLVFKLK